MRTAKTLAILGLTLTTLAACDTGGLGTSKDSPFAPTGPTKAEAVDGLEVGDRLMAAGQYELALDAYTRAAVEQGAPPPLVPEAAPVDPATLPLTDPGEADITAHVDFGSLAAQAASLGCAVFGPVSQAAFLRSLGIVERTTALLTNARPEQAQALQSATQRLIDPAAMGDLFKALVVAHAGAAAPAGFETQLAPGHRQDD